MPQPGVHLQGSRRLTRRVTVRLGSSFPHRFQSLRAGLDSETTVRYISVWHRRSKKLQKISLLHTPKQRAPFQNRATTAAQALLDGKAEKLIRKVVTLALDGDPAALRLCLERLLPPRKERHLQVKLPAVETARQITSAMRAVVQAVAEGRIAPGEGHRLARVLEAHRKAIETAELEERVAALERRQSANRGGR